MKCINNLVLILYGGTKMIEFYNKKETEKFIKSKEKYVYVDDGVTEVIIPRKDIPDFIVYVNREIGMVDLKIYDFENEPSLIITTMGEFLDKCDQNVRQEIIDRLIKLQMDDEQYKKVKVFNEDIWEQVKDELEDEEELE